MTREEAIKFLSQYIDNDCYTEGCQKAHRMAVSALQHQMWEEQLWHDAKTDPPKTPGLYYGKKDDTNSMYACQYRDGVWVLDMYPQQKMEIVQWADYTAFIREDEETALRPVSRERVERVWPGCNRCKDPDTAIAWERWGHQYCSQCGRPLSPEAWEELRKRMEALKDGKGD